MICSSQEHSYEAFVEHSPRWNSRDISSLVQLHNMEYASIVKDIVQLLSSIQIACVQSQSHFIVDCDWGMFEKCLLKAGVGTAWTQSLTGLRTFAALSFKKWYHLSSDIFPFLTYSNTSDQCSFLQQQRQKLWVLGKVEPLGLGY